MGNDEGRKTCNTARAPGSIHRIAEPTDEDTDRDKHRGKPQGQASMASHPHPIASHLISSIDVSALYVAFWIFNRRRRRSASAQVGAPARRGPALRAPTRKSPTAPGRRSRPRLDGHGPRKNPKFKGIPAQESSHAHSVNLTDGWERSGWVSVATIISPRAARRRAATMQGSPFAARRPTASRAARYARAPSCTAGRF
jgi:hypothetical protein